MRFDSETRVRGDLSASAGGAGSHLGDYVFLSPEWVHEVAREVKSARASDHFLGRLVGDLNLNLLYQVRQIPAKLQEHYGGSGQATIYIEVRKGVARRIEIGREAPVKPAHVIVTLDYTVAKQLYLGKSSPAASVFNKTIEAKPVNGYREWSKLAAKSIIAANRLLRIARKVPTRFPHIHEPLRITPC